MQFADQHPSRMYYLKRQAGYKFPLLFLRKIFASAVQSFLLGLSVSMIIVTVSVTTWAQEDGVATLPTKRFVYYPRIKTSLPLFLGAGLGVSVEQQFRLELLYGLTPRPYYEVIGSTAAWLGDNAAYGAVIEAAFQNNSIWHLAAEYSFSKEIGGWSMGMAYLNLQASGRAGIDSVLSAATGLDYTQLANLLIAAGRSSEVNMYSNLHIVEVYGGYSWVISPQITIGWSLGIAKVLGSQLELQTGLPNFEASNLGKNLIAASESELEAILDQYGMTPTLGLQCKYTF